MIARLRGYAVLLFCAVTMVAFFLLSLPVMIVTGSGDFPMWLARKVWSPACLWVAGARLDVRREATLPDGPLIFACNHESALDIWAILAALPRTVRFIAKVELFRMPVFGWYMRLGGHIPVDRANRVQAVASLRRAGAAVRAGTSLIVFPEGTRSKDGLVHPFKKGPFVVAREAGVPVIPVAVSGAGRITPKKQIAVEPGTIHIGIGAPVDPAAFPDRNDLLVEVRKRVIGLHRRIGGRGGDERDAIAAAGLEGVGGG